MFGATLGELLLRTQHHHEDEEEDEEEEEEEEEDRPWEGQRRRSSDGLSTVTSGPSRSHSPSPSIASSAAEAEVSKVSSIKANHILTIYNNTKVT